MEMAYTYWEGEGGWLIGYLNDFPDNWTQGKDITELEEMLLDLYINFKEEAKKETKQIKKNGKLRVPA
ncbi:MAG: type II toxin-antitoxin system HicB family antitoxin [Treponema sp.]|nr:type II toxin-antitoxin system HicB family antitoxin [Treponema sp.]